MDGGIKFDVSANTAKFEADMGRVANSANISAGKIKEAFKGLSGILAGGAIAAGLKQLMDDFDKIAKVATRFGASAEEIQRVSAAADLAGVSIDTVARVLTKMSVAASNAAAGNDSLANAFAKAGINAEAFKNSGLDEQLIMLSEAFNKARGSADQTNQIIELMGTRAAGQMIPLIDNTSALSVEMQGVSVVSDRMVRKIEEANDRLTRSGKEVQVFFANVLSYITETFERIGHILSQEDGLMRLIESIGSAIRGNFVPLYQLMQTSKTISEMEEIEARAQAIKELTDEKALGFDAVKNFELIKERTQEILEKTQGINQQMSISEDTTDSLLGLERDKTTELSKQAEQLANQEEQRQNAIRSMNDEIALIEAKLSGNKKLEESLREQSDFQSALNKTGSFETAANFAATKSAERSAAEAGQADRSGAPSGGFAQASPGKSPLERLQELSQGGNVDARSALMRLQAEQGRYAPRAAQLEQSEMFRSAAAAQIRNEGRMQDRAMSELTKQTRDQFFGARNAGDAARNFERDSLRAGMTTKEAMNNMGIDRKLGESTRSALDRFAKDQAKTETERAKEAADSGGGGGGGGGAGGIAEPATEATLKEIFKKIQERPILVA